MSTNLSALVNRARSTTTLAALVAGAVLILVPAPSPAAPGGPPKILAQGAGMGSKPNARVGAVQRELRRRGYDLGRCGVDGRFGPLTAAAVRRMQADYGLAIDGAVGSRTRRVLRQPSQSPERTQASSPGRHRAVDEPVSDLASLRRHVAPPARRPRTTTSVLGPSASRPRSAIAAAVLGVLLGAVAALAFAMEFSRRQSAQSGTSLRGDPVTTKLPRRGRHRSPDWWAHLPDRDDRAEPVPADAADRGHPPSQPPCGRTVIGYITVSADLESGEAERWAAAIKTTCRRSDWNLLEIVADRENGPTLERPGLGYALDRIAGGHASGLVVSDLQRLSRSIVDLGVLMAWFRDANAALIALDLGIDTSTAEGHHVATTLIALSARAKERIADGTRNRLAERRATGGSTGRPAVRDRPELMQRIATMRAQGMTLQAIADQLNAEHVPTLRGGMKWRPSSIQAASGYRRPGPREHLPRPKRDEKYSESE